MKLLDFSDDSYVYSVSYRLWISSMFAPCTMVSPMNRDASKAVVFIWKRKERGQLAKLHYETLAAVMEVSLERLRWLAVLAFLFKDSRYKGELTSVVALKLLHDYALPNAEERMDAMPGVEKQFSLSEFMLSCLDSLVPLTGPGRTEWEKAVQFWQTALNAQS